MLGKQKIWDIQEYNREKYDFSFNNNEFVISSKEAGKYAYGTEITLAAKSREGYTFTGWSGSNGNTPSTSVSIAKGSTGNKTYTASYEIINYTITYNLNGGSVESNNLESYTITLVIT